MNVSGVLGIFLQSIQRRRGNSPLEKRGLLEIIRHNEVWRTVSEAISHDDVPFESMAEKLSLERGPGDSPFPGVAISLQQGVPEKIVLRGT